MRDIRRYIKPLVIGGAAYAARGIGSAIQSTARGYANRFISGVRSRFRRGNRSGSMRLKSSRALTQQHDIRSTKLYRQRSGRKWRKFRAKVRAAIQADNPRHIYQAVYKASGSATDSVAGFAGAFFLDLQTSAQGDISNVFKDAYGSLWSDWDNYKLYIKNAQMDFLIKNTHATNACEIDLYECVCREDVGYVGTPADFWATYFSDLDAIGTVTNQHPGLTPYQVPNFIRQWKIIKTTKFMVDPGKAISVNVRRNVNKVISGLKLSQSVTVAKGLTTMMFFRIRGIPENSTPTGSNPGSGLGAWSCAWSAITNIAYQSMPTADQTEDIDQSK